MGKVSVRKSTYAKHRLRGAWAIRTETESLYGSGSATLVINKINRTELKSTTNIYFELEIIIALILSSSWSSTNVLFYAVEKYLFVAAIQYMSAELYSILFWIMYYTENYFFFITLKVYKENPWKVYESTARIVLLFCSTVYL
jgi:hypothetical protein